ncbi:MAG: nucleotidyltransferase family protein [Candidatus Hydrogenedentes bacterium]|nr:nucleotidyltransferase family protein [Candidatus Hydrogenedentota bacterium]
MLKDIALDRIAIKDFCSRWDITEFALFGSILRSDFGPDSDIDVLVTLSPLAQWDLFDWIEMRSQLETLLGRQIDLVEKSSIRNPYRREGILAHCETIYAA